MMIKKGTLIEADGMSVMLEAENIEVNGTIIADQIDMRAETGTDKYGANIGDLYDHYKDQYRCYKQHRDEKDWLGHE